MGAGVMEDALLIIDLPLPEERDTSTALAMSRL
jgi:hypothetical protein